jgi:hypothetical protein
LSHSRLSESSAVVNGDVVRRLVDGVDPSVITTAEATAGSVAGVRQAHARARWTRRTLRVDSGVASVDNAFAYTRRSSGRETTAGHVARRWQDPGITQATGVDFGVDEPGFEH